MGLTLEQQFQKRRFVDCVEKMNKEQLLENLKEAHFLLKQKNHALENLLQNEDIQFIDTDDPSFKFSQIMTHREFENYDRETLVEVLLNTLDCLMHTDNNLRDAFKHAKIDA